MQKAVDSVPFKGLTADMRAEGPSDRFLRPEEGPLSKTQKYAFNSGYER